MSGPFDMARAPWLYAMPPGLVLYQQRDSDEAFVALGERLLAVMDHTDLLLARRRVFATDPKPVTLAGYATQHWRILAEARELMMRRAVDVAEGWDSEGRPA